MPSSPFPARFPGVCANDCGEPIRKEDLVVYVDDLIEHIACQPRATFVGPVCKQCFLVKPCFCGEYE